MIYFADTTSYLYIKLTNKLSHEKYNTLNTVDVQELNSYTSVGQYN